MSLEKTVKVKIQSKEYEVGFPTIGQILDIETRKHTLSNGQYRNFDLRTRELLDATSCFSILIPALEKDLVVDSIFDLNLQSGRELVESYKKDFKPWFEGWLEVLHENKKDE